MAKNTIRTKRLIKQSFINLLKEKEYNKITILDITNCAGFNRNTFYNYYHYKDDLLNEILQEKFDEMISQLSHQGKVYGEAKTSLYYYFSYIAENGSFFKTLIERFDISYFRSYMKKTYHKYLVNHMKIMDCHNEQINSEKQIYSSYMTSAIVGVVEYWIKSNMKFSPIYLEQELMKISIKRPHRILLTFDLITSLKDQLTNDESKDPRIIRTQKYIKESLCSLLLEKKYNTITINDISDQADVNRVTLYKHYYNKENIFSEICIDYKLKFFLFLKENLNKNEIVTSNDDGRFPILLYLFYFIEDHFEFFNVLFTDPNKQLVNEMFTAFKEFFGSRVFIEELNKNNSYHSEIYTAYITSAIFGTIEYWIENKKSDSPKFMAETVSKIIEKVPNKVIFCFEEV